MYLIVGLGNPGKEYEGTRHNVGFEVADAIAAQNECKLRRSLFQHAHVGTWGLLSRRVAIAKPTTYMNESGKTVAALVRSYRLPATGHRLLVLHDDLDLPVGTLRITSGGSSGGHRGVQSIIDALGTEEFTRIRIGIGPNVAPNGHRIPAETFVLELFRKEERPLIDAAIQRAIEAIAILLRDGLAAAQRFAHAT